MGVQLCRVLGRSGLAWPAVFDEGLAAKDLDFLQVDTGRLLVSFMANLLGVRGMMLGT
ncbi:hypothetical protein [Streptomyces apocyni]|uniref:hypothetical protein n=1 Tax=Streptomyces apocyni TaxID=2654677 RepID=UPI0018D19C9E|nr:hypothetical protein [Streptomyces apocyni]